MKEVVTRSLRWGVSLALAPLLAGSFPVQQANAITLQHIGEKTDRGTADRGTRASGSSNRDCNDPRDIRLGLRLTF